MYMNWVRQMEGIFTDINQQAYVFMDNTDVLQISRYTLWNLLTMKLINTMDKCSAN